MKKHLLFLLCLISSLLASAQSGTGVDDLTWTLKKGTLTISGTGDMPDYYYQGDAPWSPYRSNISYIVINDGITSIGNNAFFACTSLISVTIPNSVTSIGDYAFECCTNLPSIIIPNSVTSIGDGAFRECYSLTSITIPNSVTRLGSGLFTFCDRLTSVNIPSSLTSIGDGVFGYCGITSITIPESITSIGDRAFLNCNRLKSITIPNSVTRIGDEAFGHCDSLTYFSVLGANPPSTTSKLLDRSGTSTVHVYKGLYEKYKKANGWSSYTIVDDISFITSITLDATQYLCVIGEKMTPHITAYEPEDVIFKEIKWSSSDPSILEINADTGECIGLKDGIVTITATAIDVGHASASAYVVVEPLESNSCGDSLTWTSSDGALIISGTGPMKDYPLSIAVPWYKSRSSISRAIIGEGVTNIGDNAFNGCTALTSVTIPNTVTNIGENAFAGCDSISEIYAFPVIPPTCYNDKVFDSDVYKTATVYVPDERNALLRYFADDVWKKFLNIYDMGVTSVNSSTIDAPDSATYLNLSGQRTAQPLRGLNIVNGKKVLMQ